MSNHYCSAVIAKALGFCPAFEDEALLSSCLVDALVAARVKLLSDRAVKVLGGAVQLLSSCSAVILGSKGLGHVVLLSNCLARGWIVSPSSCLDTEVCTVRRQKKTVVPRTKARSNSSSSFVPTPRSAAGLWGAIGSGASAQQLSQRRSYHLGGTHTCKVVASQLPVS